MPAERMRELGQTEGNRALWERIFSERRQKFCPLCGVPASECRKQPAYQLYSEEETYYDGDFHGHRFEWVEAHDQATEV